MQKVLVTGANGFIGSNLVKHLLKEGNEVSVLLRKTSNLKFLEGLDITYHYGDITDKDSLQKPMEGIELLFHVAGLAFDWGPYEKYHQVNYIGTQNVVKAAISAGVSRMVHISTVAFHGFGYFNINEEYPKAENLIPYAETKYLAEKWLFEYTNDKPLEVTAIRPGNVFGTNDHTFIEKYIDALEKGQMAYVNKGKSKTCPTYIENLIHGIYLASQSPAAVGEAFFITDGLDIDWKTFTDKLALEMGIKPPKMSTPYGLAHTIAAFLEFVYKAVGSKKDPFITKYRVNNGGKDYHFSVEKANKLLGYKPVADFETSIKRTVEWYKNSRTTTQH